MKFSDLKTKENFLHSIPAAQQPDGKNICSIPGKAGKTINAQRYLSRGENVVAEHRVTCSLLPSVQPRSFCELPPVDHPHRPGSHQQSRCCCDPGLRGWSSGGSSKGDLGWTEGKRLQVTRCSTTTFSPCSGTSGH